MSRFNTEDIFFAWLSQKPNLQKRYFELEPLVDSGDKEAKQEWDKITVEFLKFIGEK